MLMAVKPAAAQAGATSEHVVESRHSLRGAFQVLVSGEGVTGEVVPPEATEEIKPGQKPPDLLQIKVKFTVAADALPGVREFRLATPQGASTVGQLVIVRDPVVAEADKNDTADAAQVVQVPSTLCGVVERAEDVDFYKFSAKAGQSLNFHVRSMRLEDKIHDLQEHCDPILTLKTAAGATLAASDNYFYGDPFLAHAFAADGEYLLEIRDVRYKGNVYWTYSIEVSDRPFVRTVHPLAARPGEEVEVSPVGAQLPDNARAKLTLPAATPLGVALVQLPLGEAGGTPPGLSNPVQVVVSDLPPAIEAEGDNNSLEKAQAITLPVGLSGRIESEADIDFYAFDAKAGERYSFEIVARRAQSALDSHLRLMNGQGQDLIINDDLTQFRYIHADSQTENWTVPADGKYAVAVRDLHLRGGPDFTYFLRFTRAEPYFELYADTDKTELTPGTGGVVYVRVVRKNGFSGEVQLAVEGLPLGATATCGKILADKGQDGAIIFHADGGAMPAIANVVITGTAKHALPDGKMLDLSAVALPLQETYMPGGGRGHFPVLTHAVCIGAPSDLRDVKLSTYELSLKPGESKSIDVEIVRAEGFSQNVTLDVLFKHLDSVYGDSLPPGVTLDAAKSTTLLTGDAVKGQITLTAAPDAPPCDKQLVAVMANVSINFVMKATYAAKPVVVSVEKPGS